jgi:hypothetical protein
MTQDDWRLAVYREMRADLWYEEPDQEENVLNTQPLNTRPLIANRNGNSPKEMIVATG